jgi:iron complex outermembrane receptor protein
VAYNTKKILVLFLLSALSPSPALAQLQITITKGHAVTSIDDPFQAQAEIEDVPGNASIIDDKQWSSGRAQTVKDITDYIPGVMAQPRNGAESMRLSIRGSGLANAFQGRGLLVLQDGIPINTADGEFEFPVLDPWLIRYAEVFPGANALEYGASSFGGAINFITPTGITANGYGIRGEGGSFGTLHGQLSAGKEWQSGDVFAAITGFSQDGFRRQNEQQTGRFNANWGWQASDHFINRVYLSHTVSNAQIPGAITLAQVNADPRAANPNNLAGDYQRNLDITRLGDKLAWEEGADRVDATFYYTYRHLDNPVTTYEFQHNNDMGMQAKYTHRYGESRFLVGMNHYYGMAGETRYRNMGGNPGAHILDRNLYALTSETYGQVEQKLAGKLFAIIGAQGSYALRNIHQGFPAVATQNEHYTGFSPRIGLRYDIASEQQIFANLSRSFEPPTWAELSGGNSPGFNKLKAQSATTAEIGARVKLKEMHWQAAYFHGWLHNEFVNYRFADGSTDTINAASTKRDGIELGLDGDAAHNLWLERDALNLRAAYTFSHYTLDHDPLYGNNTLPGVPKHYVRAEALYRHPSGISIGPNIEWSPGRSPVDLTNSLHAPGYAVYGARVLWESEDGARSVYIEGRNLLNKSYVATYNVIPDAGGMDGRNFYPGEGRAVYAGLKWSL